MTANPSSSPPIVDPEKAIRDRCLSLSFDLQKEIDPSALERLQQLDMDKAFRILDEVQGKHDLGNASAFIVSKVQKVFREEILEQWGKKLDHEDTQQFCEELPLPQPRCFNKLVQRLCLMCVFVAVLGGIGAWFIGSTGTSSSETCAGTDAMECKAGAELLAEKNRTKQLEAENSQLKEQKESAGAELLAEKNRTKQLEAENSQLKEQKESAGEKLFKILTQIGVDVNKQDEKGATPLHIASQEGHRDLAEMLLRNGAAVNQADEVGWGPLHIAALRGNIEVVKLLVKSGAKIHATSRAGTTPLNLASDKGHQEIVKLLQG